MDSEKTQGGLAVAGRGTPTHQAIAKIWTEVLHLPSVDTDANFFDIGGDSMKAMEVILRVSQVLHVELPLMAFFEDPTVDHLSSIVDELGGGKSASEEALTDIWLDVLHIGSIDKGANFFDIGGDSMKAMEVIVRVGEVLHVELPLMAFFEDPTIAHLAAVVDEMSGGSAAPAIARVPGRTQFPLSYSQEAFWLLEQQNAGTGIYNTARVFILRGRVDAGLMERSLNEVRRRHEILRVRFIAGTEGPLQVAGPVAPLRLDVADLSSLDDEARSRAAQQLTLETVREPFDLEAGPALRARLVRLTANDSLLCIAIHHVISDGYTGSILLEELTAIYDAFAAGQPNNLPEPVVHFTDFAAWERETIVGTRLEEDLAYWRPLLRGAPTFVDLPVDHESASASDRRGHLRSVTLPRQSLEQLQLLTQSSGATLFTVLMAGFRILLYRWSGQTDFMIGTIASNRSRSGTERMVGCFVNTLPLRNPVVERQSAADLIRNEKTAAMNAFAHQDCPFGKIVEAVNPERTGNDNPLFNVALLYQSYPAIAIKGRNFEADDANFDAEVGLIDLRFIAFETAAGLQIDCEFRSAVYEIETVDKLLTAHGDVLSQMVAAPDSKVDSFALPDELTRRAAAHQRAKHKQTIAIAANFTAEPVEAALAFWMKEQQTPSRIEFAPFDQVFQQLLDPGSVLGQNKDGCNLVLVQWRESDAVGAQARELAAALKAAAARSVVPTIVCICPPSESAEEAVLAAELAGHTGVHVLYPDEILGLYPVDTYRDEYAEAMGAIPYTDDFFVALASMIARRMHGLKSTPCKVIVLDCDNTLWKGVCGEDGALGVEVDAPRRALQEFMLAQRDAGVLLCLCSKNVEADVDAVFDQNPGMLLSSGDILASRVNWHSKSENLKELAEELNLGVDSIVLIDDNPLECAEVRANCPGVTVLELPVEAEKIPDALHQMWAFDHWSLTAADRQRSERYQNERARDQMRDGAADLAEFLRSLELAIDIRPMTEADLPRVSQLTYRTNQFNTTTVRRSESEIAALLDSGSECLVIDVRDRFGDYGLVGVAIFATISDALIVDTLLMSCGALGRRVEHQILASLGEIASQRGLPHVQVKFVPSARNTPALDFLESVGAQFRSNNSDGATYIFPAAYARVASAIVADAVERTTNALPIAVPAPAPSAPRADLEKIARDLGSVKAIARTIHALSAKTLATTDFVKPRTATEEILAGIWAARLRTPLPGIHDDFFRLGGNSLLAVQVISRIRHALGVELPLRAMFEAPTLAALAERIETIRREKTGAVLPPLIRREGSIRPPASFAQQRLWFIAQLEPDDPAYNIPQIYRLHGELNQNALHAAIQEIIKRHEALRTTFDNVDGEPVQRIAPEVKIPLPIEDLTSLGEEWREAEVSRVSKENAAHPFNLETGPLLSAKLLKLDEREHVLLLTLHHIVGDGWSGNVLARELMAIYEAFSQGRPSPLPELAIQYADFAIWQRSWVHGEVLEKQVDYWKRQLAGAPAVLELPTDHPRPAVQRHRGAVWSYTFSHEFLGTMNALSQAEGVTLFMTLLAGFQLLLSRYSGQEDIVVGSTVAGRNHAEIEPLIGFFVNTLALRADLTGDPTFRELLGQVRHTVLDGIDQQEIPFERLVEELRPERSLSYNPVFQVLFGLQDAPSAEFRLPDLKIERASVAQATSVFDLSWSAFEMGKGLRLRVEYDTDLFDESTIAGMASHFESLMACVALRPETRVSEISLLEDGERHQILVEFNPTSTKDLLDVKGKLLHDFLAEQAEATPDRTAFVAGDERITYRELNARANSLANYLIKRGAGPDVLIGIHARRSVEMLVGILGILKAGSAYVPLDPNYPKKRLADILQDSCAPLLLTQEAISGELPDFAGERAYLDADWEKISQESSADPVTTVTPQNLAYVLFTSGSTGRPKGVAIEHHSVVSFVRWAQGAFTRAELEAVLLSTSMCFDLSVFEMFVPLSVGGRVILAENALYLPTLPARDEVTLINTVPSAIAELVRMAGVPESVTTVNLAGEALPDALVEEIYAHTATERVYNLYGPTEDTTYSTYTLVQRGSRATIGRPISGSQAYILDVHRKPVPIGVPGELFLAGEGLARGYYGRPDLTAERFVPNPFADNSSARMYRTGDTCRWQPDGNIRYMGRMDHQVKLRGFRIELGEIEATLDKHSAVRQSVAIVREDDPGLPRLVAYAVLQDGRFAEADALREHVRQNLPDFMTPTVVMVLEALPQTPNGKIDRKALPAPEYTRDSDAEFVPPRTETEEGIAAIWSVVLKLERVGVTDNFFELGGHSLLATQVVSRVRKALGVELPLRFLFEYPTVAALASKLEEMRAAGLSVTSPIKRVPRDRALPLSFAQQRMWFLDLLEPGHSLFNIPSALRVHGHLDAEVMQRAVDALVERHETLRSNFSERDGEPLLTIAESVRIPVQLVDLSSLDTVESEREAMRFISVEAPRPFNLAHDLLLRVFLIRLSAEENILLLNMHHIISDRWSVTVLLHELSTLYEAFDHGKRSPLPELPVQYADFADWQREASQGEDFKEQVNYWMEELQGAPAVLELPTDRPRPPVASLKGEAALVSLPADLAHKLNALSRENEATLYMTLLAAFEVLLSRYSGQEDLVVGMPIASRNHPEVEGLVGLFANTLPLRMKVPGSSSFVELLARTKEAALGAYAHQDVPFEKLVEEIQPERSLSYDPLVQVSFILQNAPHEGLNLSGLRLERIPTFSHTSKGDLYLSLGEHEGGINGRLEYAADLFDERTIRRFLGHYENLLEAIVKHPDARIDDLALLAPDEEQQMLFSWNATGRDYRRAATLPQLFEEQVRHSPGALACISGDAELTYGDLNARANRLAHHLLARGVGTGTLVGVCLNRSEELLVTLLAILKCGAAYLPLDPSYPQERLNYILDDAKARLMVTEEAVLNVLPGLEGETLCVDTLAASIAHESSENPLHAGGPEALAYVLHTSGSTGKPKGVEITQRNLINFLTSMRREPGMTADDRLLAVTTLSFDIAGLELYLPLITGAGVVISSRADAGDPAQLMRLLDRWKITVMQATPATWLMLLQGGWKGDARLKILCGGEGLPEELAASLVFKCRELWNMYGPTETTIWSSVSLIKASDVAQITIGRPIANTTMYVLDQRLKPVPIGVAGELYIGGEGVANGYWKRPELTTERFVADPYSTWTKMYRTGDLAKFLPDGTIQCLGRADDQVKIRGFRIELGEIETVLSRQTGVRRCVVLAREDVPGNKQLVAYVVADGGDSVPDRGIGESPLLSNWKAGLSALLPDYMVPKVFVSLDEIPLTANGKVNRVALPAPDMTTAQGGDTFLAPRTPKQEMLAAIMADVLQIERIGLDDNFFEMGGHSLSATQVIARARVAFSVEVSVRLLFEAPTLGALAEKIEQLERGKYKLHTPPLVRVDRSDLLPLSFAQQRMWFMDQLEPDSPLYSVPYIVRMKGVLHIAELEASLQEIVKRHETLRTTFEMLDDQPVQVIHDELHIPIVTTDLRGLPEADRLDQARSLAVEEVRRPFNLKTGPLLRASLFTLDQEDHALVINTHHIISDRWSLSVLSQELAKFYEALIAGTPISLPDLTIQYADYAVWQRELLSGSVLEGQLSYWKHQLEGSPALLALPVDRPRQPNQDFLGAIYRLEFETDLVSDLRKMSRKRSATLFMTLLAAFQILMARCAQQDDIVIGTDLANRTQLETERLIGFFVNLLPMRVRMHGDPTFVEVLTQVREASLGAYAHQDIPFDKLVEELQPERRLTHNPLVQVLFVMQNTPHTRTEFGGLTLGPLGVHSSSRFDLVLFINDPDTSPFATWMYNPDLFNASSIQRMAKLYDHVLREIAADPEIKLSHLRGALDITERAERETMQKELQQSSQRRLKQVKRKPAIQ